MGGCQVDVIGQASVWNTFDNVKGGHNMQMLVTSQQAEEILVDLDTLIELSIVPADFPLPQDPELRSEKCRRVEENKQKAAEYLEQLEKKGKEDQTDPSGGNGLRF